VESTVVEVLILNGLGESSYYEMVILVGRNILRDFFEGSRGGGA
jgi:hypothetical protein